MVTALNWIAVAAALVAAATVLLFFIGPRE
jgi:hypothetical protein